MQKRKEIKSEIIENQLMGLEDDLVQYKGLIGDPDFINSQKDIEDVIKNISIEMTILRRQLHE